jgi:hypothetical protein
MTFRGALILVLRSAEPKVEAHQLPPKYPRSISHLKPMSFTHHFDLRKIATLIFNELPEAEVDGEMVIGTDTLYVPLCNPISATLYVKVADRYEVMMEHNGDLLYQLSLGIEKEPSEIAEDLRLSLRIFFNIARL